MNESILNWLIKSAEWFCSFSVNDMASWASIIGLILNIWLLLLVKKIKQKFIKKVRIPEIIKDLGIITSNISTNLSDIEANKLNLFLELNKCESILKNVSSKVNSEIKSEIHSLLNDFKKRKRFCWQIFDCYPMNKLTENDIYDAYAKIASIKEALIQEDKDLRYDNE